MNNKMKIVLSAALCVCFAAVFTAAQKNPAGRNVIRGGDINSGATVSPSKTAAGGGAAVYEYKDGDVADRNGCNKDIDEFIKGNAAVLKAADPRLVLSSCDFNAACTADVWFDSGAVEKNGPEDIINNPALAGKAEFFTNKANMYEAMQQMGNPVKGWSQALSGAWKAIAKFRLRVDSRFEYRASRMHICRFAENTLLAGSAYSHSTKLTTHSFGRVYILRCCPNARCKGGYFDDSSQGCKMGTRPAPEPAPAPTAPADDNQ